MHEKMLGDRGDLENFTPIDDNPPLPDKLAKITYVIAVVVCFSYALGMSLSKQDTSKVFFLERDPTISYPHVEEQVSVAALMGISIGLPLFAILVCSALLQYKTSNTTLLRNLANVYFYLGSGLAICLLASDAITNNLKILVLRPRPNFLAYCNYKGYGEAVTSGNYTAYNAATTANAIGSLSSCSSAASVQDAILSFPSGHSSLSFCGMTYIALLIRYTVGQRRPFSLLSLDGLVFISPFYLSSFVAISRIIDFYHHCDDVMMGSAIGIGCALAVFNCVSGHLTRHVCAEADWTLLKS